MKSFAVRFLILIAVGISTSMLVVWLMKPHVSSSLLFPIAMLSELTAILMAAFIMGKIARNKEKKKKTDVGP